MAKRCYGMRKKCVSCDRCIAVCPNYASPKIREMSAEEVFEEVSGNLPFIRGITVSGGECCLYPEFLKELFGLCKEAGLSCLIDSNGMVDFSLYPELLELSDGVMLDTGTWKRPLIGLAGEELTRFGLEFLVDVNNYILEKPGSDVVVVGGGNVAMDAARTALRLGAEVHIVYRRSEAELPARVEEVHHAKEEGIIFDLLTNPVEILTDENDWVKGMVVRKMELGEPDASGRRRPVEVAGSDYTIEVDTVIMSLGTSPNPLISSTTEGLETNKWKCIVADEANGKTTKEGVYAGGDAVTGAATVILAMEAGRAGARGIDEFLSGK